MEDAVAAQKVETEEVRGFDKAMFKIMNFLGLTSGTGFVGLGSLWFLWSLANYFLAGSESAMQQIVEENYFNQALMSLMLVGVGILITEIKKLQK